MTMTARSDAAWPRARLLGDRAITIAFGNEISPEIHARVMGFAAELERRRQRDTLPGVIEWVPSFAAVTLYFDDTVEDVSVQGPALLDIAMAADAHQREGLHWRIPVCFDEAFAPDLQHLADTRDLTPAEVVALMCGTDFRVYMLGFQPGFPYLGGLPAACDVPRLASPRRAVPERSLAVAGRMCAVYPWESPGGWHLLGRTPLRLFDITNTARPALLAPGDTVRWCAIDADRYRELDHLAAAGQLDRERFIAEPEAEA
ncbi:MAG: 5-oxoprolinase subunit PxpB [Rhodocyclaceae bacterium]